MPNRIPSLRGALTAAALAALAAHASSQPAPAAPVAQVAPGAAPMRAGPAAPPPLPVPGPGAVPLDPARQSSLNGRIGRWLTNPNGEVDGLLLVDGTQVAFPPHLSARATAVAKPGDEVQLTGWREGTVLRVASLRNSANGQVMRDDGPPAGLPAPRDPGALTPMSASGRIETLLHGPRGEVNGVVLQSGEQVRFAPHVGPQFATLLQPGAALSARGYGTRNSFGAAFEATAIGDSSSTLREVFTPPRPPAQPVS